MSSDAPTRQTKSLRVLRNFIQQDHRRRPRRGQKRRPHPHGASCPNRTARPLTSVMRKAPFLNFGLAKEYGGKASNLRFDDTNPAKEEQEYVDSIVDDELADQRVRRAEPVQVQGSEMKSLPEPRILNPEPFLRLRLLRLSFYAWAVQLIEKAQGVRLRPQPPEERPEYRGTLTEPGKDSPSTATAPSRRTCDLFRAHEARRVPRRRPHAAREDRHGLAQRQHARPGALPDPPGAPPPHRRRRGASIRCTTTRTARAIRSKASPTRSARSSSKTTGRSTTGSARQPGHPSRPQQIEFARLEPHLHGDEQAQAAAARAGNGTSTAGTIRACPPSAACAAAATPPKAMRAFCERIGVAKFNSTIDMARLEDAIREDLNERALAPWASCAR